MTKEELKERNQKIVEEYINTPDHLKNLTKLAEKFGLKQSRTVSKILKDAGIKIYNTAQHTSIDETIFDVIDTEEKAYWLGFMYADGCIYSKEFRMELSLQGSDTVHLQKFAKFLKSTKPDLVKVYHNYKQGKYDRCRVSIRSKHLWETLNNKGCVPNKSLILEFPNNSIVPNYLIKHFIRGYIDGDGCLCTTNPYKIELNILGTLDFLTGVLKNLPLNKDYPVYKVKNKNYYTTNLWCSTAIKIIKFLYEDATIYLDRKYEKYLEVCRLEEESFRKLSSKIGEDCDVNPEVNSEIAKGSESL
jgi:intein-encoded DNA endonuclease-like protein